MRLFDVLPDVEKQLSFLPGSLKAMCREAMRHPIITDMVWQTVESSLMPQVLSDLWFLYALIRNLKPHLVLEVGTGAGRSAIVIACALEKNGFGNVITVDIDPNSGFLLPQYTGTDLLNRIGYIIKDITFYVTYPDTPPFDFIHEDGAHSAHSVHVVYDALPKLMPHGGVIISHDTATGIGDDIRRGMQNAGIEPLPPMYQWGESPCGFSVMQYEGIHHE